MSWKTCGKVLLLVALGVTSSLVTSRVIAQGRAKKRASSANVPNPSQAPSTVGPTPAVVPSYRSTGFASIEALNVVPVAGGIRVSGQANLQDVRPNVAYVWSVRVRHPVTKALLAENRYDGQIFQIPKDTHKLRPTFDDAVTLSLPPGAYKAELALYEVPPGGVGLLDDPDVKEHQLMAKHSASVTIGR